MGQLWARIRRVWVICGSIVFVVFTLWASLAYQASAEGEAALESTPEVSVERADVYWLFRPRVAAEGTGLLFFAGALVEAAAYAPLARAVATARFPVLLIELPRRGAFGGGDGPEVLNRARGAMARQADVERWVVAGHSLGGRIASAFARSRHPGIAGLVLVGTSHPRDISLADATFPVTRIYGTRDTVADVDKIVQTRRNLPPSTREVAIDGGNHSQFGYYGFQPGDWPATISREAQQRVTLRAILDTLQAVSRSPRPTR
jgi:pimeloyl-ACP methyl ester carboxylesterase